MKKSILIFMLVLLPLTILGEDLKSNPFVRELAPKVKTTTTLKVYKIKTQKKCAHPQDLTEKQANKIFHSIKIKGKVSVLVLNNEDIRKVLKKFIKTFKTASPNEMVVVEKTKNYLDTKNKKDILTKIDKLVFWFKDSNNLVVFYKNKGYNIARILETGFHVTYYKENGKTYKSAIVIQKDVWTKYLNKAVFEKDYEKTWENLEKNLAKGKQAKEKEKVEKKSNKTEQTISIEEMQKELQRLKDMLDKKLITEEEYNMLKKNVLKKAGL